MDPSASTWKVRNHSLFRLTCNFLSSEIQLRGKYPLFIAWRPTKSESSILFGMGLLLLLLLVVYLRRYVPYHGHPLRQWEGGLLIFRHQIQMLLIFIFSSKASVIYIPSSFTSGPWDHDSLQVNSEIKGILFSQNAVKTKPVAYEDFKKNIQVLHSLATFFALSLLHAPPQRSSILKHEYFLMFLGQVTLHTLAMLCHLIFPMALTTRTHIQPHQLLKLLKYFYKRSILLSWALPMAATIPTLPPVSLVLRII